MVGLLSKGKQPLLASRFASLHEVMGVSCLGALEACTPCFNRLCSLDTPFLCTTISSFSFYPAVLLGLTLPSAFPSFIHQLH